MKYSMLVLVFACAIGCGDSKPPKVAEAAAGPQWPTSGKPLPDEAAATIQNFFADPNVLAFTNVKVDKVSDPVEAPKQVVERLGEAWVCSVTMHCNNAIGDKQQNKNWLVLIDRENGHATVKDYFYSLDAIEQSSLGKEWFAQKGFPKPEIEQED